MWWARETIYLVLFVQAAPAAQGLTAEIRGGRVSRRAAASSVRRQGRGQIVDAYHISEHLAEADNRAVPGHWRVISSSAPEHPLATLVERSTRFRLLVKVPSTRTDDVVAA